MDHEGLLVITNNIHVATILMPRPKIEVIVAGGMLRKSDGGIVGEAAVDFITQFKVDHAVIGASAIDEDGAMLDFDYREVRVAKAIMKNARNVMLVADAMKFTRTAPVRTCCKVDADKAKCTFTWPPSSALSTSALPLNGTWVILIPLIIWNSSPHIAPVEPFPPEPMLILPGLALA